MLIFRLKRDPISGDPSEKERDLGRAIGRVTRRDRIATALVSLAGALLSAPPAALFGAALGYYPNRMQCTPETGYGSGCYEGELLIAVLIFGAIFLPLATLSFLLTRSYRQSRGAGANWWPFAVQSLLPLVIAAGFMLSALANPNEYF